MFSVSVSFTLQTSLGKMICSLVVWQVARKAKKRETVIPDPDYRIPIVLLGEHCILWMYFVKCWQVGSVDTREALLWCGSQVHICGAHMVLC